MHDCTSIEHRDPKLLLPRKHCIRAVAGAGSDDATAAGRTPATFADLPEDVLPVILGHLPGRDAARMMSVCVAFAAAVRCTPEVGLVLDLDASPVASGKPRSHTKKRRRHASAWCGWPVTLHRKRALMKPAFFCSKRVRPFPVMLLQPHPMWHHVEAQICAHPSCSCAPQPQCIWQPLSNMPACVAGCVAHEDGMASLAAFLRIPGGPKLTALHMCISGSSRAVIGTGLPYQLQVLLAGERTSGAGAADTVNSPFPTA